MLIETETYVMLLEQTPTLQLDNNYYKENIQLNLQLLHY